MKISLSDSVNIEDGLRRTADGYLVGDARVARTGVQVYRGRELGMADRDTIRVYRPEEEVFRDSTIRSYAHRPITMGHPKGGVNSKNWKTLSVGQTGDEVVRDGNFVRVPLVLMDEDAIGRVEGQGRELSMGYSAELEFRDGVTLDGEPYDAVMTDMRMNHLAIVAQARGGSQLTLGDGEANMADSAIKTRTVVVDGLSIDTTEQGAQVIEKLQKQIADAATSASKLVADHSAELARKDAEIDKLQKQIVSDADIEKRVAARTQLIDTARGLSADVVVDGKSEAEIKKATVAKVLGDSAVEGKDEAYISVRFQILADDKAAGRTLVDPVRNTLRDGKNTPPSNVNVADAAYEESVKKMTEAWNVPAQKVEA